MIYVAFYESISIVSLHTSSYTLSSLYYPRRVQLLQFLHSERCLHVHGLLVSDCNDGEDPRNASACGCSNRQLGYKVKNGWTLEWRYI